ncbi:MAG: class I SAM-dependent methyltransferase [Candidatus Competibacteraceae bacterium]|nr:MAG: class I SAM-dependent methyltransferase [Candidatus Competibacteraceae bacterium]
MKFEQIHSIVGGVPFITEPNARFIYNLIVKEKLTNILELGIAHGTATCYMAAALQNLGKGLITAVDLIEAKNAYNPSIEVQLARTGLSTFVEILRMKSGYTWFLHDEIVRNSQDGRCKEIYDLCIVDGPKNWTIDGAAFFLVDKLLKPNGWIIFDDYLWTYAAANYQRDATDGITHRSLSKDEQEIPHIREIFELLVKQHPNYGNLILLEGNNWVLAQKNMASEKTYTIIHKEITIGVLNKLIRKAFNFVKHSTQTLKKFSPR